MLPKPRLLAKLRAARLVHTQLLRASRIVLLNPWESMAFHSSQPKTHPEHPWANSKRQLRQSLAHLQQYCQSANSAELTERSTSPRVSVSDGLLLWAVLFLPAAVNSSLRHFHSGGALLNKQSVYPTSTSQHSKSGKNNLRAQWKQQRCRRQRGWKWMKIVRKFHVWVSMKGEMRVVTGWH